MSDLVQIKIETQGDPAGAEEVAEALAELGDAAEESAEKAVKAAEDQAKAAEDGAKRTKGAAMVLIDTEEERKALHEDQMRIAREMRKANAYEEKSVGRVTAAVEGQATAVREDLVPAWEGAADAVEEAAETIADAAEEAKGKVAELGGAAEEAVGKLGDMGVAAGSAADASAAAGAKVQAGGDWGRHLKVEGFMGKVAGMAKAFGGLGALLGPSVLNPVNLVVEGVGVVIEGFKGIGRAMGAVMEKAKEYAKTYAEAMASPMRAINAFRGGFVAEVDALDAALAKAGESIDRRMDALAKSEDLLRRTAGDEDSVEAAKLRLEKAKIKSDLASGAITEDEAKHRESVAEIEAAEAAYLRRVDLAREVADQRAAAAADTEREAASLRRALAESEGHAKGLDEQKGMDDELGRRFAPREQAAIEEKRREAMESLRGAAEPGWAIGRRLRGSAEGFVSTFEEEFGKGGWKGLLKGSLQAAPALFRTVEGAVSGLGKPEDDAAASLARHKEAEAALESLEAARSAKLKEESDRVKSETERVRAASERADEAARSAKSRSDDARREADNLTHGPAAWVQGMDMEAARLAAPPSPAPAPSHSPSPAPAANPFSSFDFQGMASTQALNQFIAAVSDGIEQREIAFLEQLSSRLNFENRGNALLKVQLDNIEEKLRRLSQQF